MPEERNTRPSLNADCSVARPTNQPNVARVNVVQADLCSNKVVARDGHGKDARVVKVVAVLEQRRHGTGRREPHVAAGKLG